MLMPAIAGVGALRDAFFASGAGRKRSPPTPSLLFCPESAGLYTIHLQDYLRPQVLKAKIDKSGLKTRV